MATLNSPIEGAIMIAGTVGPSGVSFSSDTPYVVCKSSPVCIAHSGVRAIIWDDILKSDYEEEPFESQDSAIISTVGSEGRIYAGHMSNTSALGFSSRIDVGYMTLPTVPTLSGSKSYVAGNGSHITTQSYVTDSVLIASGDRSYIMDEGESNTLIITGNNASTEAQNGGVIVVTGENSEVMAGSNTLLTITNNSGIFTLDKNSVAIVCWKDASGYQQVTVVREGEEGIQSGLFYKVDNNGRVIPA